MLRVDPRQRGRLIEIIKNLAARIQEARMNGWLGEVEGLRISLNAAEAKLAGLDRAQQMSGNGNPITSLGIPVMRAHDEPE